MNIFEMQVRQQAEQAVEFIENGGTKKGANKPTRKMNPYGIALKYIFAIRDQTFEEASKLCDCTAQNLNYIVNRKKESSFNTIYIDKLCRIFNIDRMYFRDLVKEIRNVMEGR